MPEREDHRPYGLTRLELLRVTDHAQTPGADEQPETEPYQRPEHPDNSASGALSRPQAPSSFWSQLRANVQSRFTVRSDVPSASAVSELLNPAKNRHSTTRASRSR